MDAKERLSIAVAEAIVAAHLGLARPMLAARLEWSYDGPDWIKVALETPVLDLKSKHFTVEVGHKQIVEYERQARLRRGETLISCYYWSAYRSEVTVSKTPDVF